MGRAVGESRRRTLRSRYARGLAWTLDRDKADWFARRWPGNEPRVYTAQIDAGRILGYFVGCNEAEVVVDPADLPRLRGVAKPRIRTEG